MLDEAFSGLDLETEARVREHLWEAFPDRTALVISHWPVGLDEFNRILFLHDGVLTQVTSDELRTLLRSDRTWTDPVVSTGLRALSAA